MQNAKLEKLIKCLNMASSSHDGEAINAVRLATQILKAEGWTWEALLTSKVTLIADPFTMEPPSQSTPYAPKPRSTGSYYQPKPRKPRTKKAPINISLDDLFGPTGPTI